MLEERVLRIDLVLVVERLGKVFRIGRRGRLSVAHHCHDHDVVVCQRGGARVSEGVRVVDPAAIARRKQRSPRRRPVDALVGDLHIPRIAVQEAEGRDRIVENLV